MKNRSAVIWSGVYVAAVLIANYTATMFIPLPLFGLLAFGTLVFGVTFTARDYVHSLGRRHVYTMIAITGIMASIASFATDTPIRIVIASFITILIAETVDTEVYHRLLHRAWLFRVGVSNAFSVPVDTVLFATLAFAGDMPVGVIVAIVYADIVAKWSVGIAVAFVRYVTAWQPARVQHATKLRKP